MPRIEYRPSRSAPSRKTPRALALLCRVLLALALVLVLVIAAGTVYALVLRPKPVTAKPVTDTFSAVFTGLGRLRCPTSGPNPGTVILQATFPYDPQDRPFSEELASRVRDFRSLALAYFGALRAEEISRKGEDEVKAELLAEYNALLRLGRIETLYFNEYMLID
jgi:flagellar basal body-associated protein FliL